jgi:hypothetical protein
MQMPMMDLEMLKLYILGQVEYYFSVENLCRDVFFRMQVRRSVVTSAHTRRPDGRRGLRFGGFDFWI